MFTMTFVSEFNMASTLDILLRARASFHKIELQKGR